ncbi:MAG: hypothetical protein JSW00_11460 [Thermoplasmata archaeon]|nr:MAG: hypothetical protein JSW00_11460 [Thermoplasmata archaeon]
MDGIRKIMSILVITVMAATVIVVALTGAENSNASLSPVSGAIFTTLEDGSRVNANIYEDKRDVYLDGGPGPNAPPDAAGLPDGNYYFQVTNPSGKKLLSIDCVGCREFRVEGGVIVEYVSMERGCTYTVGNGKNAKEIPCHIDGKENGQHDVGEDLDHNALTIQLMPYKDTPNKGGVYKVWATPIEHFVGDPSKVDNGYKPGYYHGFIPRYSKTDNFKVRLPKEPPETPEIKICKWRDCNSNGVWDTHEIAISGWKITVLDPLGVENIYYTCCEGCVIIYAPKDGTYIIKEEIQSGWTVTATIVNGVSISPTDEVTLTVKARASLSYSVVFGNHPP